MPPLPPTLIVTFYEGGGLCKVGLCYCREVGGGGGPPFMRI